LIIDPTGRAVGSSGGRTGAMSLPLERLNALRTGDAYVGDPYWDVGLAKAAIVLAVPIRQADGRFIGALSAKTNLRAIADTLPRLAPPGAGEIYVLTDRGKLVLTSHASTAELMRTSVPAAVTQPLLDKEGATVTYERPTDARSSRFCDASRNCAGRPSSKCRSPRRSPTWRGSGT